MTVTDPAPMAPSSSSLIARVQGILLTPAAEWDKIDGEAATSQQLMVGYAAVLAAIPALSVLLGTLIFSGLFGIFGLLGGVIHGLVSAALIYILSLAAVFVLSLLIDAFSPTFDGIRNKEQALKVAVYANTAGWIGGFLLFIPVLGWLIYLGGLGYTCYLLYLGVVKLLKPPADKAAGFGAVIIVAWLIISSILWWIRIIISASLFFGAAFSGAAAYTANNAHAFASLQSAAAQIQAQANGQPAPAGSVHAVPADTLKSMLPDNLPSGFARTEITASSGGVAGISGSNARGVYTKGDSRITLDVTDMAAASAFASLASTMNVQSDSETATGYNKVGTVNGRMTTEEYDRQANSGKYSVLVANRFLVDAEGSGVSIDDLKAAVSAVGLDRLQGMAHA